MLKFLLEKEFKQIMRDSFLPRMIFMFPIVMMIVLPNAANMEVKNINVCVLDNDHSSYSTRLVTKIGASPNFHITDIVTSKDRALVSIESDKADVIIEIERGFERNLENEGTAKVMISANAVNGTKGGLGSSYVNAIVADFSSDIRAERIQVVNTSTSIPTISTASEYNYNESLDYKKFMAPAIMVQLLTILCGFLPALNIVREKESGTIEQLNVTPILKRYFILAKLIPYWLMGFIVLTVCFAVARLLYGIAPVGNLLTIYFFAAIFILAISGLGLVISNNSSTMQQAMFVMFFFLVIMILMSGLFTPVSSMPQWAQDITIFNPLKYFIQVMRMVYLKGSSIFDLKNQFFALISFVVFFNTWAVLSYKKNS
jgi:ABC-2 type transport system permease protein